MGQKTNPIGFRLGVINTWDSNWYEEKSFSKKLKEDALIRNYLKKRLEKAGIAKVVIERTLKKITLTIHTSRPGFVIGKSGKEITQLESELKSITNKEVKINVFEIKKPELSAQLVAENIANQLSNRVSFRRAMKMAITSSMKLGAQGIKVMCSGRLGGAEIARSEQYKEGRIPLQTLRADIDYASVQSMTIYGIIGVKVWICRGEKLTKSN
ncbi:MAG TPA: 30S ribosomal protein S3 [Bacteroidetes bacterium]|nr:30S ribosomal protein S3 [Ignavibacteria bacterium]HCA43785.1 30S ribosomal protein S3 [Bacteroidota bacterium]HCN36120.1 30S ribosomal protein S3 [Bacteroidota bacterium]